MIKSQTKLLTLTIMLLLAAILIVSFGCGGDSSGVVPEANVSQTDQTETLVTKDVEGVIYNISNSNKDTEEEDTFTVLPISMEGDEGFLAQVNEYVVENSSSKASDDDMQELLTAFNEEAENYQPLPIGIRQQGFMAHMLILRVLPVFLSELMEALMALFLHRQMKMWFPWILLFLMGTCLKLKLLVLTF